MKTHLMRYGACVYFNIEGFSSRLDATGDFGMQIPDSGCVRRVFRR